MDFVPNEPNDALLEKYLRDKKAAKQQQPVGLLKRTRLSLSRTWKRLLWQGRIQPNSRRQFFLFLHTMLQAGVPIVQALDLSAPEEEDPVFAAIVEELAVKVSEGSALNQAMAKNPKAFSALQCKLVKVGETAGKLDETLHMLAQDEENRSNGLREIASKIAHPMITFVLAVPLTLVVAGFVLKPMAEVLEGFGEKLPMGAALLVNIVDFFLHPAGIALSIFALILFFWFAARGIFRDSTWLRRQLLKLPYVGTALRLSCAIRFTESTLIQLRSGLTLDKAMTSSLALCGHPEWSDSSKGVGVCIRDSQTPAEALEILYKFPQILIQAFKSGYESGNQEEHLSKSIILLKADFDYRIAQMTSWLQPLILSFLGLMAGGIVISVMLPMARIMEVAI